jgi:iron complex outermembrane recepter protein
MIGRLSRLLAQVRRGTVLAALLVAPTSVVAQTPSGESANAPSGQTANLQSGGAADIVNLDIEQLARTPVVVPSMDLAVTSVTKEASTVGRSAAAIFVITPEMIRRSGATSIPEALRMAPGLDVARINSNTWAISARGFNGLFANKLLVLMDGRTLYSPIDSGVYWDVQDYVLEDIERIEVIRGPGGTLWGANAVNGVINIITKNAKDTQGSYVNVGGGTEEHLDDAFRYGGRIGDDGYYRVYGKHFDRGTFYDPTLPANDAWRQGRFGFRSDWNLDCDKSSALTVQGDHYVGESGLDTVQRQLVPPYSVINQGQAWNTGEDVLMRLRHVNDEDSDWTLQTYFDRFERGTLLNSERANTYDIDFQDRFPLSERQKITWGAGYRYIHYQTPSEDPFTLAIIPPEGSMYVVSQFVQDEISLAPDLLGLTLGCKLEQNNFTGLEYQPTARLLWTPDREHSVWGAVSRAVRTPDPVDRGGFATRAPIGGVLFPRVLGDPGFQSETLIAYELGYRTQVNEQFSYDIAAFYNVYGSLRGLQVLSPQPEPLPPPPHAILPIVFTNGSYGDTYGVELATNWTVSDTWRISAEYTFFRMFIYTDPENTAMISAGDNPCHQVYLRSSWNLREDIDFDLMLRYVDCLTHLNVPAYTTMDLRLAWRPRKQLELALVGQNLLQTYHYEWGQSGDVAATGYEVTEIPRGVYGTLTWRR